MKKKYIQYSKAWWIQICFDWTKVYSILTSGKSDIMKIYFVEQKFIFYSIKIYFGIMKKSDIIKTYFIE